MGPSVSSVCQHNLNTFTFLAITLDTVKMEIRLPEDKLTRIRQEISRWLQKKRATKKLILSLVSLMQHATKVIRCGRTFVERKYSTAAKLKQMAFYKRLNNDFTSDLYWWYYF